MSLFGPSGGPLGFLSAFGYDPNSFYSTQGLISSATADSNRNLGVWQELQKRTLTQEEREDLAASILARLDEGDDSFTRFGPAGRWLEGEITAGTLESATLIDAMDDEYNWNQSALQALLSRHLSDQDHATLLEVCIGALERGSWKARSEYRGWLENEFYAGTLSPAQIERLRACNWTPGLKMPRRVPADEPFEVVLTEGEPSGLHPHIFTEQYLAVAFGGVSIDGGPFLGPELPPALALFVRTSGALEKDAPYHRDFRMETSIAEPGVHTVAVKYYLFDGQHQRSLEPIDFDSDGEPIVPENSTWILERVVEREVVVSGEQFAADG